ncbi:uncharacterized protein LOC129899880 [Solanum dulcamara]|uniref:uncharacterized protein LOC129899880 n=1 Tax=Solanum dulcamara TaxID=45834 RepID=UPI002485105B|nr:uncharacterized protein LOC129899880 [Solanum dulcamara]
MDIVVGLPKTLGKYDSIWVVVERLIKLAYFIPIRMDYNAQQLANIYVKEIGIRISFFALCEFPYNNSYHSSIEMPLFEALYRRGYRDPIGLFEAGVVKDVQVKVRSIQTKLLAAQSLQKEYANHKGIRISFFALCEFPYNNSYHSSIEMPLFEALYRRGYRDPIGLFEAGVVKDAQVKVRSIQTKLLAAQSLQKEYANHKVRDMIFWDGEQLLLNMSPIKGVMTFGKKRKLYSCYIGPFEILDLLGLVA